MKTFLKILAAIVLVAVLWLGYRNLYPQRELVTFETLSIDGGEITAETFIQLRDRLVQSTAVKKTFVVKHSGGGDGDAAIAIGTLLHRHNWDVEVVDVCASSCANFIFPAGKTKYLNRHSMLLFHGGPYQANFMEWAEEFDRASTTNGAPVEAVVLGQENKEGTLRFFPNETKAQQEVREFLSIPKVSTAVERVHQQRRVSDQFYQELGVNPLLPTYGQVGAYEPSYKAYERHGFIYRLESLGRLGIANIQLKDGEWHPERHPDYKDVYEVTYP